MVGTAKLAPYNADHTLLTRWAPSFGIQETERRALVGDFILRNFKLRGFSGERGGAKVTLVFS